MKAIRTKFGNVYFNETNYFVERVYTDLLDLIEDEQFLKDTITKNYFKIIDSEWQTKFHPLEDSLIYILKLELEYIV